MRVLLAIALAALVCASASAAATMPLPPRDWPVIQLERGKAKSAHMSCTAHTRARIGRAQRKLVPVACEQPPRSRVHDGGFAIFLAP